MSVAVELVPAEIPGTPVGVMATGAAALALARRLLEREDTALAGLRGVHQGRSGLAILGNVEALPWVDGVVYLCRGDDAPELLWPSAWRPTVAPAVLFQALRRAFPRLGWPGALVMAGDGLTVWPLGGAVQVDRDVLATWLREAA